MRKLLALATVFALMLFVVVPAGAAITPSGTVVTKVSVGGNFDSSMSAANMSTARTEVEYTSGVGGKDADDEVVKVLGKPELSDKSWFYYYGNVDTQEGYIVMSVDLFVVDGVTSFHFGAKGNTPICPQISITPEMHNRWVNITTVYNTETIISNTYIDGNVVSSEYTPDNFRGYDGSDTSKISGTVRWIQMGTEGATSYMDNFKLYTCTEEPVVEGGIGIVDHLYDGTVEAAAGLSFADAFELADSSSTVTIYADRTYTNTLKITDKLVDDSYIVIKKNGEIRTYAVYVDDGIDTYDSTTDGNFEFVNATVEYESVTGLFGKKADDNSAKITKSDSLKAFSKYTWLSDDFEGYIRADFNIEAGNATAVYIGTDSNVPVSDNLRLNANQWNRVSVIYDTNSYNSSTGLGTAVTYVNGVKQSELETPFYNLRHLRIVVEGETGAYAYADDFELTHYETSVPEPPASAKPANAAVSNGTAYVADGMTVAELKADMSGTTIRVYSDVYFAEELASTAVVSAGNYIVMETFENVYSYYPAAIADANTLLEVSQLSHLSDNSLSFVRGATAAVYGYGGKAADDESIKVTVSEIGDYTETDAYCVYTWNSDGDGRYLVAEINVFPDTAATVGFATNGHGTLAGTTNLVAGRWNKVVMVFDTQDPGKTTNYLNGELSHVTSGTAFEAGKQIRLRLVGSAVGDVIYIDDFRVYETNGGAVITMPDVSSYYQVAQDGKVTVPGGTALIDMSAGDLTLRAYTDSTYLTEVVVNDDLTSGQILVAEDVYKSLSYYTIVSSVNKNILAYSNDGTITNVSGSHKGYSAAAGGIRGKDASDKAAQYTVSADASDVYLEYKYENPATTGYLVFEATAYFGDSGSGVQMAAGGNNPLTSTSRYYPESDYRPNQWNKYMYVYNIETNRGDFYINGEKVSADTVPPDIFLTSRYELRLIYYGTAGDTVYYDDVLVYETNVYPNATKAASVPENMKYVIYNYQLFMASATEYADLSQMFRLTNSTVIRFLDSNNNIIQVAEGDTLPKNAMLMTLYNGNGTYTTYDVKITDYYNGVAYGPAYSDRSGTATTGTLKVAVPIENLSKECVVAVAAYGSNDNMKDVWLYKADNTSMYINCVVPVDAAKYSRIAVMVLDNMVRITPYAPSLNIPVQ
ncbi:MAG: hypothetical protein IJ365_02255 [Clostridia bacterium]|nr:hypothetical protein [Clostridia bacterium]